MSAVLMKRLSALRPASWAFTLLLACGGVVTLYRHVGARASQREAEGLFRAARAGDVAAVERAVQRGVPVDVREPGSGFTPLACAARNGRAAVARVLLARGADPRAAAPGHGTPLSNAAWHGDPRVVELLLAAGAPPDGGTTDGHTP